MQYETDQEMATVLLVDDDEAFLQVLGQSLHKRGFQVSTASTLAQVDVCLAEVLPKYAIIDLHLGDEHGLDVLDLVRSRAPATIPVILSGYIDVGTAAVATKRGAVDCLVKPVSVEELEHAMLNSKAPGKLALPAVLDLQQTQLQHIICRWEKNERNTSRTAAELGMHRRTLQRILERAGIVRSEMDAHQPASRVETLTRRYRHWMERLSPRRPRIIERES